MITSYTKYRAALMTLLAIILLVSLPGGVALGQTTRASLLGTVSDEKGSALPNAKVIAKNLDTGITRETTTEENGNYRLSELPIGRYEVEAQSQGFGSTVRSGIELTVGSERVVNFSLTVGNVQDRVVIEGGPGLVETTNSTVGFLVSKKQIEELPLNGRDVLQLATLQNGVLSTSGITGNQDEVGPGTTRLSVNGGRIDFNAYFLDGTETSDAFGNSPGGLGGGFLGVDALQEFAVLTSNYAAEFGKGGGAIVNAITKSGTNEIHGTAFEFLRNSAMDARNFFNAERLPFRRNQFGGSLGGPIVKNRTFIFGNYEGLRRSEGTSAIFNVPSPAARQGNLTTGQVTIAPSVVPYLNLYPLPNGPISGDTGVFRRDFTERTREDFFVIRADHAFTEKHSMAARYTFDDSDLLDVSGVIQNLELNNRAQYVMLEGQSVHTPRAVSVFRFSFARSNFISDFPFNVSGPENLGFIPGHPMGGFSLPGVSVLREALTAGRNFALNTFEPNYQFIYNRGNHSLKFGGGVRRYQLNAYSPLVPDGIFIYGGGIASFLTGSAQVFYGPSPQTDYTRGIRQNLFGFFVQDDWKVRPNLTINMGLRYEPISTPTEVNGKIASLRNFSDRDPVVGDPFFLNPSKRNFGPRLGIAWDPTGKGKTSVRAGAGVFYSAILPMKYRFFLTGIKPFMQLNLYPGVFPDAYERFSNSPLPLPSVVWLTQFNAEQPTVYQWNLTLQHEVARDLVLSAGYVGSRGVHLETGDKTNVRTDFQIVNGRRFYPAGSGPLLLPNFGAADLFGFNADSHYHGLQLMANKRYSSGIQFQFAYTFSKSLDTGSSTESTFTNGGLGADRQDPLDAGLDYGRSDFDARHNFVANFLWDIPLGQGLDGAAKKFVAGWAVGGIVGIRTGFPFPVVLGFDRARNGIDNRQSQRPDFVSGRTFKSAVTGDPERWVDPTAFQVQPAGFYGTAGRNILDGPNLRTVDFTLTKRTAITERLNTEFRAEFFNIFNRANFAPPAAPERIVFTGVNAAGAGIVPGNFAQITSTATSSRQIQLGIKLIF